MTTYICERAKTGRSRCKGACSSKQDNPDDPGGKQKLVGQIIDKGTVLRHH